jgi:hypothetical protein
MKTNNNQLSHTEIIMKLKWFHGEDFEKYPLVDELEAIKHLVS